MRGNWSAGGGWKNIIHLGERKCNHLFREECNVLRVCQTDLSCNTRGGDRTYTEQHRKWRCHHFLYRSLVTGPVIFFLVSRSLPVDTEFILYRKLNQKHE